MSRLKMAIRKRRTHRHITNTWSNTSTDTNTAPGRPSLPEVQMPSSVGQQLVKLPFSSSSAFKASGGRVRGVEVVVGVVGVVHGRLPTPSSRLFSPSSSSSSTWPQTETRRLRRFPTFATSLVMNWPVNGSMKHSRTHCSGMILSASSRMSAKWELFLLLDFLLLADSSLVEDVESLLTSL